MYYNLATELYELLKLPENRVGQTLDLMDQITNEPDRFPSLNQTYDFDDDKQQGNFHTLLKIVGCVVSTGKRGRGQRYRVPPSYFFIQPGIDQGRVMMVCLPHAQPVYQREIKSVLKYYFLNKKYFSTRFITEQVDDRWPHLYASLVTKGNNSVLTSELKKLGAVKWGKSCHNKTYMLPDNYWQIEEATA
jgi:hypothetical protein